MQPFDGGGTTIHHAAFVGEPRAWAAAGAPIVRAGVLHGARALCRHTRRQPNRFDPCPYCSR